MTTAEIAAVQAKLAEISDHTSTKYKELESRLISAEQEIVSRKGGTGNSARGETLATKFGRSFETVADQVKASMKSGAPMFRWETGVSVKQFLGVDGGSSPNTDFPSVIERRPGIVDPPIPPTIFDALPVVPTGSNIYEYVQYDVTESHNHAAIVAEGGLKPTSTANFTKLQASPLVFAHLTKFSNQLMQDAPAVVGGFLPGKMRRQLLQTIDSEVLNGPGGGGRIDGLFTQASAISVPGSPANNDIIGYGVAYMRAQGYNPTFVIINSLTAQAIRAERATAGDGQYVGGVKFGGLPTVESPNVGLTTALILDSATAAILEREQIQFQVGLSDDDFSRNLWTGRCEARLTMAVFDLGGVRKVTLS